MDFSVNAVSDFELEYIARFFRDYYKNLNIFCNWNEIFTENRLHSTKTVLIYTLPNCLFHIVCPSTFLIFFDNKAFVHINFIWIILKLANSGLNMHIFDTSNLTWIVTEFPDFSTVIYCVGQKFACLFMKLFRIFRSSLEWNFSTTLILNKNTSGLIHGLH